MKSRDKQNLKNLSVEEMQSQLHQDREKMFKLQFKHSTTPLANPLEMRTLRRKIAMLETFVKEKSASAKAAAK